MAPRRTPSPPLGSNIQDTNLRSGYGDMYATRYAASMVAHVAHLRSRGMIDEDMAVELLNPFTDRIYSSEYLATHPDYTGEQPEMSSIITAERRRLKQDKEMNQFVEDYEAGRIDDWGNAIAQEAADVADQTAVDDYNIDMMSSTISNDKHGSDSSQFTGLSVIKTQLEVSTSPLSNTASPEVPAPGAASLPPPVLTKSQNRKSRSKFKPLKPRPDALDYSEFKYGELVAECRRRKILGGGCTQSVRNRLIQDDIDTKQDLQRELIPYNGRVRKNYRYEAPAAMRESCEKGENR